MAAARTSISHGPTFDDASLDAAGSDNKVKRPFDPGIRACDAFTGLWFQLGATAGGTIGSGEYNLQSWLKSAIEVYPGLVQAGLPRPVGADEHSFPLVVKIRATIHKFEFGMKELDASPSADVCKPVKFLYVRDPWFQFA